MGQKNNKLIEFCLPYKNMGVYCEKVIFLFINCHFANFKGN